MDDQQKPTLREALVNKRSLVFVPTKLVGEAVQKIGRALPAPRRTSLVDRPDYARTLLDVWNTNASGQSRGELIVVRPIMSHGVWVRATQVIWIGDEVLHEGDAGWPEYVQCMSRADGSRLTHSQPIKLHYRIDEVAP